MAWSRKKRLVTRNTKTAPTKAGVYKIHNRAGKCVYMGRSKNLKHRISSYHQKDDFKAHPTKKALRGEAYSFSYRVMPNKKRRRAYERRNTNYKYNVY